MRLVPTVPVAGQRHLVLEPPVEGVQPDPRAGVDEVDEREPVGDEADAAQHAVSLRDELVPGRALARALERDRHEPAPRSAVGGDAR